MTFCVNFFRINSTNTETFLIRYFEEKINDKFCGLKSSYYLLLFYFFCRIKEKRTRLPKKENVNTCYFTRYISFKSSVDDWVMLYKMEESCCALFSCVMCFPCTSWRPTRVLTCLYILQLSLSFPKLPLFPICKYSSHRTLSSSVSLSFSITDFLFFFFFVLYTVLLQFFFFSLSCISFKRKDWDKNLPLYWIV